MTGSALYGQPPSNPRDYAIVRGLLRAYGFPPSMDPGRGIPTRQHAPPNYHFETRGPGVIGGLCVAILLAFLITGTRLLLRLLRKDLRWGLDDWVIIPAGVGTMAWMGCQIGMVTHGGIGKHIWDVTYEELFWFFRLAGISEILFYCTVGMIKVSITLFNRRLTGLTSQRWMIAHYTFLFLLVCYIIIALFVEIFKCIPPGAHYSMIRFGEGVKPLRCLDWENVGIAFSSIHVTFDFALLSVPLIILYKIKMDRSKKIRLAFLFSVGAVSCIASAMRHHVQKEAQGRPDLTWNFPVRAPWTLADIFFGLVAASLPVLNAALPRSWRSRSSAPSNLTPASALPLGVGSLGTPVRLGSKEEIHTQDRYLGRFSEKDSQDEETDRYRSDSLQLPQQAAVWTDSRQNATLSVSTYREEVEGGNYRVNDSV